LATHTLAHEASDTTTQSLPKRPKILDSAHRGSDESEARPRDGVALPWPGVAIVLAS